MVATVDLWVYDSEIFCVSLFNQVTSIFHLRGGKIKKKFFWAYVSVEWPISQPEYNGPLQHSLFRFLLGAIINIWGHDH